jgi:hypothetical protein
MRFKFVTSLSAVVLAAHAHAQNLALSVKFSTDRGATWSSNVVANGGTIVQGAIFMSGDNVYGLGGATLRMIATSGTPVIATFGAGTDTGRVGPFNFRSATNAIYTTANGFRIDAASDPDNTSTAAGMTFLQRDPSTGGAGFSISNPALCFRFDVWLIPGVQQVSVALDQLTGGAGTYYSSSSATRPTSASVALNSGSISAPAPSTFALILLGPLVAGRRRRS